MKALVRVDKLIFEVLAQGQSRPKSFQPTSPVGLIESKIY
jgi:hypothetical protein